jgi:hypothetical protein
LKIQHRIDYKEGKADNLTNILSVYNKSDEHEVILSRMSRRRKMNIVETIMFNKLKEYREQENRERFILPKDKDIEYY